jgi:hypothetical protein
MSIKKVSVKKKFEYIGDASELSNSRTWVDFLSKETLNLYPGKDEWRQRLIYTLLKWSERKESLEIMQFCIEYKIPRSTLWEWVDKYPDVKEAYENAKLAVACHRRLGSMNKKLDGVYAYKDMHMYDPTWHAINKYHSDMKKEEEKQSHTFIINDGKPRIISKEEMMQVVDSLSAPQDNEGNV